MEWVPVIYSDDVYSDSIFPRSFHTYTEAVAYIALELVNAHVYTTVKLIV